MTNRYPVERLSDKLVALYGVDRALIRTVFSPYRICPLGAHIDHQLGLVTAMALDQGVQLAFAPIGTPEVRLRSLNFPGEIRFHFAHVPNKQKGDWGNFMRGAVRALQSENRLEMGLVGITAGSLADGGLSSSAAVGVAYLLALEDVNGLCVSPENNVTLDQSIENSYLGLRNGILDQSAILLSRKDHLTVIDCRDRHHERIPVSPDMSSFTILIAYSGLQKALTGTDYNLRVTESAEAARILLSAPDNVDVESVLGNVTVEQYDAKRDRLDGPPRRRAKHFFSEMDRVRHGIEAWRQGDLPRFGRLVTESGASSIDNYECGAPPLVDLYHLLIESNGVYGARFSGAGFRGCCLALVDPELADTIAEQVGGQYSQMHPDLANDARFLFCRSGDGARVSE